MCLRIRKELNICVKKCYKRLEKETKTTTTYSVYGYPQCTTTSTGKYKTPFRETIVPDNGWLTPPRKSMRTLFEVNTEIEGGFIHAYVGQDHNCFHPAYAIQVKAEGQQNDLVARAVYIPAADTTENKEATVKFLENGRNKEALIKKFPFLKGKI